MMTAARVGPTSKHFSHTFVIFELPGVFSWFKKKFKKK